jgi:hypothetical protein
VAEDEGADEHTEGDDEAADTSREGQSNFFTQYADNELGIPDDSDRPSKSSRQSEADDDDSDDAEDADTDGAHRDEDDGADDDDLEADEEGDEDEDDGEEDEEEDDAPAPKSKKGADEDDDEGLDADFLEAAERNKLPTNFEEVVKKLPAEARRPVRAALKGYLREAQAGYTRLAQENTAYRGEKKQLVAEIAFTRNHPEDYIVEAVLKDPTLLDRINKRLPDEGDERAKRIELLDIENRKKELAGRVEKNIDTRQQREERGQKLERFAKKLAAHYGIDYELVEDRLILEVQQNKGDITDDRVREIIKARAAKIKGGKIAKRAADRKSFVQQKIADRKKGNSATAKSRRLSGRVGAPARTKDSDDLRTNLARSVARLAPNMAKD